MIKIHKVSKSYFQGSHRIEVLNQLNLEVSNNESVAILGQSGCGKSTLLSLLAGLDVPDSGTINIAGQDLSRLKQSQISDFRARTLGIVFQQYHLMSNLTALENVGLPLELIYKPDFQEKSREALGLVGLSHRLAHFPSELSGGECQRVAIARAIVAAPKVILADEPSGNLDNETGDEVMKLLFRLSKERKQSLILVTHNQELAHCCDRTLFLTKGKLKQIK
jgi:putative ABC transport system ATP-binding protein